MYVKEQANRRALRKWVAISGVTLLLAFAGVVVSAVVSVRQARLVRAATAQRVEIDRHVSQLQTVLLSIDDAETGQRGYLLTGKRFYLAPYRHAVAFTPLALNDLRAEQINDPALAASVRKFRELVARKLSELAATIRLHDAGDNPEALSLIQSDVGERTMEQVRQAESDSLQILRRQRAGIDAQVIRRTALSQRLELVTLAALILCGLFAALQAGTLWLAHDRYERALGASERQHRAIVEDQTELISLARPDGGLEFINPAYSAFFGVAADSLPGRSLYDSLSPDERIDWTKRLSQVLESDEALYLEQFLPASENAAARWIAWRHRAQHAADGVRIHSVGREITLRKRAEEELKSREDFLVRIGRVAGVGGWSMDLPTQRIYWSSEVRRIHEVSDDYMPDLDDALAFFPPGARATMRLSLEEAAEQHRHWDLELPFTTSRGKQIWVRSVGEAESGPDGKPTRLVGALQDITERKATEESLRELTEAFDSTPDFIAQTDWKGHVHYLNPAARGAVGLSADAPLAGRVYSEFYTPETNYQFILEIIPAVKERGVWIGETHVLLKGGRVAPVSHMVIGHRDAEGRVSRYTSMMRDITSEVANRQELAKKTSTLNSIVEAIPAMLAVWDGNLCCQLVNRAFERWRGRPREGFLGRSMEEALGPEEYEYSGPWVERALAGETVVYERDYPSAQEHRHLSVTYTPLRLEDGSVGGFIGLAQDITHHREERLRLAALSEHDPLTGLLNRAGFETYIIEKVNRAEGATLAVLYVDLDYFKPVNDRYGHAAGDEVLRQFAVRLKTAVRPTDAIARLGGDEFGIVLAGVREPSHAATVADKVVRTARVPFKVGTLVLEIGASVGVAYNADLEGGWKGLLARADAKVYEAKAAGRGRCVLADFEESAGHR